MSETAARPNLEASWLAALEGEFGQPYMQKLKAFLVEERARHTVFPAGRDMFNAFNHTPLSQVRVVVLGQDPYHGPGQAHGLCFSVRQGVPPPPSLQNIFKELGRDLGVPTPRHGELTAWARQGVLLLNTVLSVRAGQAGSHANQGWEQFTDRVIRVLAEQREGLVFVLWGAPAQRKAGMIATHGGARPEAGGVPGSAGSPSESEVDARRHLVLAAPHPSPLSAHRGFFGCGHFSRINEHLQGRGEAPIDWALPD